MPRSQGAELQVGLPPDLRDGAYVFSYRVVSADSHPVAGAIAFSIGRGLAQQAVQQTVAREAVPESGPGGWPIALRALRDAMLLLAAGGALFHLGVGPFPAQRRVLAVTGLGAAFLSIAGIPLQGAALLGNGEVLSIDTWRTGGRTSFGTAAMVAATASLAIAFALAMPGRVARALLLAGGLAVPASLALTGHAAAARPAVLGMSAMASHALAAAFWAGSLVALLAHLKDPVRAATALHRFSRIAVAAVALLVAAGAGFAAMQIHDAAALVETRYGNLILAKVALLVALLGVAAHNRFALLPALDRAIPQAPGRLRRAIAIELALVGLVVACTAALTQTPPPPDAIVRTMVASGTTATLTVTPSRSGRNAIAVALRDRDGGPLDPAEISFEISNPTAGVEALIRSPLRSSAGQYVHAGSELAFPGIWRIVVRLRIGDFEWTELPATIELR